MRNTREAITGHLKATGHFFGKFITWNPVHKSGSYRGMYGGQGGGAAPVTLPLRSRFWYRIFHVNVPKKCPVAFQWPESGSIFSSLIAFPVLPLPEPPPPWSLPAALSSAKIQSQNSGMPNSLLVNGRQSGTFSDKSYGKSYTKIWVLKRGYAGPPFKIQIFV